jgi:hypothetical protein
MRGRGSQNPLNADTEDLQGSHRMPLPVPLQFSGTWESVYMSIPPKALRGGISKSILDRFVNLWQQFPTKWLQNRPQIPKPSPGIPPHRAFCGTLNPRFPGTPRRAWHLYLTEREIGNLLPNNRRQRRTCYALCHILYPVSAAHTSIFRMDSNSTSYIPQKVFIKSFCKSHLPHKSVNSFFY